MGGANLVLHAAGWLGGSLTASFEKLIIDCRDAADDVGLLRVRQVVDADTLALDAVREVGPAGHYFGAAHTMAALRDAPSISRIISNWDNYDTWMERGQSKRRAARANRIWKRMLTEYEQPPIDPAMDEALRDYMERLQAEGGSPLN